MVSGKKGKSLKIIIMKKRLRVLIMEAIIILKAIVIEGREGINTRIGFWDVMKVSEK